MCERHHFGVVIGCPLGERDSFLEKDLASVDARNGPARGFVGFRTICEDGQGVASLSGVEPDALVGDVGAAFLFAACLGVDG